LTEESIEGFGGITAKQPGIAIQTQADLIFELGRVCHPPLIPRQHFCPAEVAVLVVPTSPRQPELGFIEWFTVVDTGDIVPGLVPGLSQKP
jgi:hypothetical protein